MSNRVAVNPANTPPPAGPYSKGILVNGFLYTAGLGPQDPSGTIIGETIEEQTRQVMRNILAVLAEVGMTAEHIVKTTVHLQHLDRDFPGFNAAYKEFLAEPFPVRTTVGSQLANILVEIDVVATHG